MSSKTQNVAKRKTLKRDDKTRKRKTLKTQNAKTQNVETQWNAMKQKGLSQISQLVDLRLSIGDGLHKTQ